MSSEQESYGVVVGVAQVGDAWCVMVRKNGEEPVYFGPCDSEAHAIHQASLFNDELVAGLKAAGIEHSVTDLGGKERN